MIQGNVPKKNNDQATVNKLLWRILMDQGGSVRVRYSDFTNVPKHSGINVDNVPGTEFVEIKAVIAGPISLPTRRIIT